MEAYLSLVIAFLVSGCLLSNIFSLCLLSLAAVGLSRLSQFQARCSLPVGSAMGFWSAVILGSLLAALFMNVFSLIFAEDFLGYALLLVLMPLVLTGFWALIVPRLRRPIVQGLAAALVTLGVMGLFGTLATGLTQSGDEILSTYLQISSGEGTNTHTLLLLRVAFGLALPLVVAIILSVASRVKRIPVSVGLVSGFRAETPLLVFALMLVYGGLVLWTVRQEARVNYGLERSLHGEGQYLAQMTGETWPEK